MRTLLFTIASLLTLFGIWVGVKNGINSAAAPVALALVASVLGVQQKERKAVGHKLAFLLAATFFISVAIYLGVKNSGANLANTITIPVMLALLCFVASCLDELKWDVVATISIPIFGAAGMWFDVRAFWFVVPSLLYLGIYVMKENEIILNRGTKP